MPKNQATTSLSLTSTMFFVGSALLLCSLIVVVGLVGHPAGGLGVPPTTHVVHVQEYDFGLQMPSGPLPSGNVVFVDTNRGTVPHELVMFKLSGPHATVPLRKDGSFNEDSAAVENVLDSGSALAHGETRILSADLDPGTYLLVCNLPAHYRLGMHQIVTVK
jgi:uncharacterized cupredoxin-like copper-binding protein